MSEKLNHPLYKILVNGRACHGGDFVYSLPTEKDGTWTPGGWHEEQKVELCRRGFHLTDKPGKWLKWGAEMYHVEAEDIAEWNRDEAKCVARKVRLTKPAELPEYWQRAVHFVQTEIPAVKWFQPSTAPLAAWKISVAPTWDAAWAAAGDAAEDAAWAAARDAAWAAAGAAAGDAAWAAARDAAWAAAGAAARDAAWAAAGDAAEDAAWAAAGDAARDARLYCLVKSICFDLKIKKTHRDHVRNRWAAWQAGYAVAYDVNGVLYCYAKSDILSVDQAAERLNVGTTAVKKYCADGLIPHVTRKEESRGAVWQIPEVCLIGFQGPKRGKPVTKK